MPKALLLTEDSVEEFAKETDYTETRLREVLEKNAGLRYVLVKELNFEKYGYTATLMDDHYFRSLWYPVSQINGKEFVDVLPKGK